MTSRPVRLCLMLVTAVLLAVPFLCQGCRRGSEPLADHPPEAGHEEGPPALPDLFEDKTPGSGVDFTYRNGEEAGLYTILETLGGGVGLIDYDGDGLLDIFVTGGGYFDGPDKQVLKGHPNRLYRNLGDWKFRDVTREVGLDGPLFYTHGCAVADYDRDGWPDLLVTGYGRVVLYHNEPNGKGGRRFADVTRDAGLSPPSPPLEKGESEGGWPTSAAFGDLDGDGYPDLYVCRYVNWSFANNPPCKGYTAGVPRDVCTPRNFESRPHALYHNVAGQSGRRRFVDVSREAGLRVPPRADNDYGKGLGVLFVDVDGDGKPDIYVANDTTDNLLYLNRSRPGKLVLDEVGFPSGAARGGTGMPDGSMGVDAADYDGSGRPSLWVTNYEGQLHALYRNVLRNDRHYFQFTSQPAGVAAIGHLFVGWGTAFVDVDGDGWEDLLISHGHVIRHPTRAPVRQRPVLFQNLGDGRFRDIMPQGGPYFRTLHHGRGLAVGDLDNDGRPDVVITHANEPVVLLRNVAPAEGRHWLGVELAGRERGDVVGARVTMEVGGRRLTRFAKGGGSYLSSSDRRLLFGLGAAGQVGRLTVEWPSGEPRTQHWDGLAADRYWRLRQGQPRAD